MGEGRRKKKREGKISKVERLELAVLEKNRRFLTWPYVCFVCLNACSNSLSSIYFIYLPPPHCLALYLHCQNHSLFNQHLFYWELLLSRNRHLFMSMCTRDYTHLSRTASIKPMTWWHDHERCGARYCIRHNPGDSTVSMDSNFNFTYRSTGQSPSLTSRELALWHGWMQMNRHRRTSPS